MNCVGFDDPTCDNDNDDDDVDDDDSDGDGAVLPARPSKALTHSFATRA